MFGGGRDSRISRPEHPKRRIHPASRCEPFRPPAKTRAIQRNYFGISWESFSMKGDSDHQGFVKL